MPLSGELPHPPEWTLARRTASGKRQVVGRFQTLTDAHSHGKVMRKTGREPSVRRELGGQTLQIIQHHIRLLQKHCATAAELQDLELATDLNCQIDRLLFKAWDYAVEQEGTLSVSHDESGAILLALVGGSHDPA